jgi:hypothetical protein
MEIDMNRRQMNQAGFIHPSGRWNPLLVALLLTCAVTFRASAGEFPEVMLHIREYAGDDKKSRDPAFVKALADARSWQSVLSRKPHLYRNVGGFDESILKDKELKALVKIVRDNKLRMAVETGGLRFVNAAAFDDQGGERQARKELKKLRRWKEAGGWIDDITTDHAIMHHIAMNHRNKEFRVQKTVPLPEDKKHLKFTWEGLYSELMDYFLEVEKEFPGCSFGVVSSLGYFTQSDEAGVKYGSGGGLPAWEFSDYVDGLQAAAKRKGVTLTHVDIDSSYTAAWLHAIKNKKEGIDVGPIAMAIRTIQSRGLKAGLFYQGSVNWKFLKRNLPDVKEDDSFDTCKKRMQEFVEALHKAGVEPDRMIIRRAITGDYTHGPETRKGTYFNIVKWLLDEHERVRNSN